MKLNPAGTAGAFLVGALAVGAFAAGTHFGPAQAAGHNLYQPVSAAPAHPALVLTSARKTAQGGRNDGESIGPDTDSRGSTQFLSETSPGATFAQVYALIERNFVDPLPTDRQMAHGAASAMLSSLQDPDSRFLEAPEVAELNAESKGVYKGMSAALAVRRTAHAKVGDVPAYTQYSLVVVAPLPGSPAEKAGLVAGNTIKSINGQWIYDDSYIYAQTKALRAVQDDPVTFNELLSALQKKIDGSLSLSQAQTKLTDPTLKTITLSVEVGQMNASRLVPMTLDTSVPTVVSPAVTARSLPGGIGYLKVAAFTTGADKEFGAALAGFGNAPKGLVLDLRNSPGGLLEVGTAIAGKLSSVPTLGYLETKGKKVQPLIVTPDSPLTCPIVVLINNGTANTAELLASALQSKGAKLVGDTTFGDASDVKLITLRDGSGFTMTVGKLLTVTHGVFGGVGIKPDVVLPNTNGDVPLDRAVSVLTGRVARVPASGG